MYKLTDIAKQIIQEENKSDYVIYEDLDGCLTNFDIRFKQYAHFLPGEYKKKFGIEKFWAVVDKEGEQFWSEMAWMPDGKELWNYIKKYNPIILSAPSRNPTSRIGKKKWCQREIPEAKLILVDAANKKNYSGFHKLLIDDRSDNCEQWRSRGGEAIQYLSTPQTILELKKLGL